MRVTAQCSLGVAGADGGLAAGRIQLAIRNGRVQPWTGLVRRTGMELRNRLYRSRTERMLCGVAGGLADYFDVDPSLVRLAFAVGFITTGPLALLLYLLCAFILPSEPETHIV